MLLEVSMQALERHLLLSDTSQSGYDVAAANLMAAVGLRGAEDLDVGNVLAWVDRAAKRVEIETLRHSYQFKEKPEEFENSPAYFSMLVLVTVLRKELGVRYNPARIRDPKFQDPNCIDPDFSDSRDLFIHGLIDGPGGTCASMPVIYAAVGRRLGYPLKLVQSKGHLFVRWDDPDGKVKSPGDLFNIEATCDGLACPPDEHFMTWPVALTREELAEGIYMKSLTEKQEVAMFRSTRSICLLENGKYAESLRECQLAFILASEQHQYSWQIMDTYKKYRVMMETLSLEERALQALTWDEEVALQKNIVIGHHERIKNGLPGYDLASFGIYPKVTPARDFEFHRHIGHHPGVPVHLSEYSKRLTVGCSPIDPFTTNNQGQEYEFKHQNQERLRQGKPGLISLDYRQ